MRLSTRLNFERIRTSEVNSGILMQMDEEINVADCVCNTLRPSCRFWALLSDYLCVHRLSSPLPFTSSFCQGFGSSFYSRGQVPRELLHLHAHN